MALYGRNLRRQPLSLVKVTDTLSIDGTVVEIHGDAHWMHATTLVARYVNVVLRHLIVSLFPFPLMTIAYNN